jgi:hypothetical protein
MALYPLNFQIYIRYMAFISFYRKRGTLPLYGQFPIIFRPEIRGFRVNRDTGALKNYSIETAAAHPAASRVHSRRRRMKAEPGNPDRNLSWKRMPFIPDASMVVL